MCMKATCPNCQRTSWAGCGRHVPSVMDRVPQSDRCTCEPKYEFEGKEYPPKAASHAGGLAGMVKSWISGSGSSEETKKEEL